jgi:1,4-dihydroxy-2-naphthoate octaprenyltransferase
LDKRLNPSFDRCPEFQGVQQNRINPSEARIFWLALILSSILWVVFFLVALFGLKPKWLLLASIAIILNGANLYGYVKCKMGGDKNLTSATSNFFKNQVIQNVSTPLSIFKFY